MTEIDESAAAVVRQLAQDATEPSLLLPGNIYGWMGGGQVHKIDLTGDQYMETPQRKAGIVTVRDVESFACYFERHSDADTEVYADLDAGTFTAVLDAHQRDGARWQQHRLVLALQQTLPWKTWLSRDRRMQSQQDFAEFVEDNARDVAGDGAVQAADLLEIAQSFQANTKVKFTAGKRLASGQTQLTYVEEIEAKAGNRGEVVIPAEFQLGIIPYDDAPPFRVGARFRYRIDGGELKLGYFLNDPARIAREAVALISHKIAAECGTTVMHGRPS